MNDKENILTKAKTGWDYKCSTLGSLSLGGGKIEDFWNNYCRSADPETLSERVDEDTTLVIDMVLGFGSNDDDDEPEPSVTNQSLFQTIVMVAAQEVVNKNFTITDEKQLTCLLFSSDEILETTNMVNNEEEYPFYLHCRIQMPFIHASKSFLNEKIIKKIISIVRKDSGLIENIFEKRVNSGWDSVFRPIEDTVVMYNSIVDKWNEPFDFIGAFSYMTKKNADMKKYEVNLEDIDLIPSEHALTKDDTIRPDFLGEESIDVYYPFIFSINFQRENTPLSEESEKAFRKILEKEKKAREARAEAEAEAYIQEVLSKIDDIDFTEEDCPENDISELVKFFLNIINPDRFKNEVYYAEIANILNRIYISDHERGFDIWVQYSHKNGVELSGAEYRKKWEDFNSREHQNLTIKTLAGYARDDSPTHYAKWHKAWYTKALDEAICGDTALSHWDTSKAFYRCYWDEFLIVEDGKEPKWLHFEKHGLTIAKGTISTYVMNKFSKIIDEYKRPFAEEAFSPDVGERRKKELERVCANAIKMKNNLKTTGFCNSVIQTCGRSFFHVDNLTNLMDSNPALLLLQDCVAEMISDRAITRKGKIEDYLSMRLPVHYRRDYHWKHPLVMRCEKWIHQIFCDKETEEEFKKELASCLYARNRHRFFRVWTGEGSNSKSKLVEQLEMVMGPKVVKLPLSVISEQTAGGAASPERVRQRNTNFSFLQEAKSTQGLQENIIKEATGGDSVYVRPLFQEGFDMKNSSNMIMITNEVPSIHGSSDAMKGRMRLWPFGSTWVKGAPETEEEQYRTRRFEMNMDFDIEMREQKDAFYWMLHQYYARYCTEGLKTPASVKKATDAYWKDTDTFENFFMDNIQPFYVSEDNRELNTGITLDSKVAYKKFKEYFMEQSVAARSDIPSIASMRTALTKFMGPLTADRKWLGYSIVEKEKMDDM